jgi:hypothetical protein
MSEAYEGDSSNQSVPGIKGKNTAGDGVGVFGDGAGTGVAGLSTTGDGTRGDSQASAKNGVVGTNASTGQPPAGVVGGNGVFGFSKNPNASGVYGDGVGNGVAGFSATGNGTRGDTQASANNGVVGTNASTGQPPAGVVGGNGVFGFSQNPNASGVYGNGVGNGVAGFSETGTGVNGSSTNGRGIVGVSQTQDAINGTSAAPTHAGVSANNTGGGYGLWAQAKIAGYFSGDVQVTGDVILVNSSGDVAEDFDVEDSSVDTDPGTVLVIGAYGKLRAGTDPYDTRVAGVVSGAGELKSAIVLQRIKSSRHRSPIALVGKAFCKVDALFGSIHPGDLLTTSSTPGHAMKLVDHTRAAGAILGKALGGLEDGRGLIPILVSPR